GAPSRLPQSGSLNCERLSLYGKYQAEDVTNFQKTRDWMRLALLELRTALQTFRIGDYSACVLHCQQSLERAVKSILVFLGKEIKRTHAPSLQIKRSIQARFSGLVSIRRRSSC
ncbi:MAG: HEPN domain-containing protein, partial [Anaerolineae bacterium]